MNASLIGTHHGGVEEMISPSVLSIDREFPKRRFFRWPRVLCFEVLKLCIL